MYIFLSSQSNTTTGGSVLFKKLNTFNASWCQDMNCCLTFSSWLLRLHFPFLWQTSEKPLKRTNVTVCCECNQMCSLNHLLLKSSISLRNPMQALFWFFFLLCHGDKVRNPLPASSVSAWFAARELMHSTLYFIESTCPRSAASRL